MFILVKEPLPIMEIDGSVLVITVNEDGKAFKIIRHPTSEFVGTEHHISMLGHFILSVQEKKDEEIN